MNESDIYPFTSEEHERVLNGANLYPRVWTALITITQEDIDQHLLCLSSYLSARNILDMPTVDPELRLKTAIDLVQTHLAFPPEAEWLQYYADVCTAYQLEMKFKKNEADPTDIHFWQEEGLSCAIALNAIGLVERATRLLNICASFHSDFSMTETFSEGESKTAGKLLSQLKVLLLIKEQLGEGTIPTKALIRDKLSPNSTIKMDKGQFSNLINELKAGPLLPKDTGRGTYYSEKRFKFRPITRIPTRARKFPPL